ncbi:hypothetical protein ABL78_4929 [Leptomonas seymouri]|uniref:Uncharacterized protein n=1 Tax=Leptomonas seymouri TaxID=5684 RepID=A0A0N0P542_LEPSE|nr:hypothetical protein ABL78_4929 [Leptomonas seymouri]|eukprot:KPI86026.1 hypothetical protein ABL78_4929 [Leptomonas seymouri]
MWRRSALLRCVTAGVPAGPPNTACTSSSSSDTTAANERSLLRTLIPMRVQAPGPASTYLRHAFIQKECLIHRFLAALEHVALPSLPRMLLAEGLQRLLEGECPQRELRALFEEAEMECRKMLLQLDVSSTGEAPYHSPHMDATERAAWRAVQFDPLVRVLAYELRAAAGYYARMMSVTSDPYTPASVLVRTLIASDMRTDDVLVKLMLAFEAWPRDVKTGARAALGPPMPPRMEETVKELLLLERDAFGEFRFDPRGDSHHLVQALKLADVTKTPAAFCLLLDPLMKAYGNFSLEVEEIYKGRWNQYKLRCAPEDHRVDAALPLCETVSTTDAVTGGELSMLVHYDAPICLRHKASSREAKGNYGHTEVFELAIENTNRSYWEKYFMDR